MADFDWGNLLYLLAIILFAVFGSRKKKKPANTPYDTEPERNKEPGILERLFSEEIYQPQPEFVQPESEVDWHQQERYTATFASNEFEEEEVAAKVEKYGYAESTISAINYEENNVDERDNEEVPSKNYPEIFGEAFDLRRAVVYSEILKRRSF
ncbi:MAG: hypothetical protein K9H64_17255 [Bacteroidales bacterium]|nr:hypothetical protein [Bacteroidales bacterium]MCF8457708.1 hypothetical protein [Bacteroidales bacterium]